MESPKERRNEKNDAPTLKERPTERFSDIVGLDEAKEEVFSGVIEPMKVPDLCSNMDVKPGAAMLLYGPPGNGKTKFARADAGELNVPFFPVSVADINSKGNL